MKIIKFLALPLLLLINTSLSQQTDESPELKQASDLTQSGVKLFQERKYDQALSQVKKGLEIRERLLPRDDLRIATSLLYLGDIYIVKRDFADAKKVLERLLETQTQKSGPDHVSLAPALDRLAMIHHRQGNARAAEDLYKRALAAREKAYGVESVQVAESLFALGQFYRSERDFERSESNLTRSLFTYAKLTGLSSPEFDRASDEYICLGRESRNPFLFEYLGEIRKQFAPPAPTEIFQTRVLNEGAVSLPKPKYPMAAIGSRLQGTVVVKVEIDETGKVIRAYDMCKGPQFLSESAVEAALKARFTPTIISGVPVKVKGVIYYNFVAPGFPNR